MFQRYSKQNGISNSTLTITGGSITNNTAVYGAGWYDLKTRVTAVKGNVFDGGIQSDVDYDGEEDVVRLLQSKNSRGLPVSS